jgi:hypothetical protein
VDDPPDGFSGLLALSDLLFLNGHEFRMLGGRVPQDDHSAARAIFNHLPRRSVAVVLEEPEAVTYFLRIERRILARRVEHSELSPAVIQDATGAGDLISAGVLVACLTPGLKIRDGIDLGLHLVRRKLNSPGPEAWRRFASDYRDWIEAQARDREPMTQAVALTPNAMESYGAALETWLSRASAHLLREAQQLQDRVIDAPLDDDEFSKVLTFLTDPVMDAEDPS